MGRFCSVSLCFFLVAGCASSPVIPVAAWRGAQDRVFDGVSRDRLEKAMQSVFEATRPGKFQVGAVPEGITFSHHWSHYFILTAAYGDEKWTVSEKQDGDRLLASASFSGQSGALLSPTVSLTAPNPAFYEIFWDRVDYVLSRRPDWVTCDDYGAKIKMHTGDLFYGFCGFLADEDVPSRLP